MENEWKAFFWCLLKNWTNEPRMCSSTISEVFCQFVFFALERLEQNSGLTFFLQWRHDWCSTFLLREEGENRMMVTFFVEKKGSGSTSSIRLLCERPYSSRRTKLRRASRFLTHWGRKNDRCYCRSKVKALGCWKVESTHQHLLP